MGTLDQAPNIVLHVACDLSEQYAREVRHVV